MHCFQIERRKISRRRSRSSYYAELGHFTFFFWRGRQRNVQRIITYTVIVLLIKPFFLATFSLPSSSCFQVVRGTVCLLESSNYVYCLPQYLPVTYFLKYKGSCGVNMKYNWLLFDYTFNFSMVESNVIYTSPYFAMLKYLPNLCGICIINVFSTVNHL